MAESAVSFFLNQLSKLLQEKRQLLGGLGRDVESIRDELAQMRGFLRDADATEETDSSLQVWIAQLREISFDVEDVLDKYMLRCGTNARRGARGCMERIYVSIKDLRARDKIAHEIQAIKHRLDNVTKNQQIYRDMCGVIDQDQGSSSKSECYDYGRREALYLEDDEVVGMEEPKEELLAWIKSVDNNGLDVISVVGMGGLGKTTLVKKVFDDESVKKHFNKHVWVVASDYKDVKDLLRSLINKLVAESKELPPRGLEGMDVDEMRDFIYEFVKESKYIVVVDDIWDLSRWESIRFAFPKRSHGCVIVTTRFKSIAEAACVQSNHLYYLKPLSPEKSEALFYKKAFPKDPCPCPPYLREFSDNILHKCEGLPLAIVVVGGLLATKSNRVDEWERLSRSIINQESEGGGRLWKLLSLSYNDLPYYLKSCFSYLGICPRVKGGMLYKADVIRLWIAEGFVESKQHQTMEEVAEGYLNQLSSRNLVQVVREDTNGIIVTFRIHDLLQDYIIAKSKEQNMTTLFDGRETQWPNKIRRLVLYSLDNFSTHEMKKNIEYLRSLLLSSELEIELDLIKELLDKCRLLKVLFLSASNVTSIPSEVFKQYHLKYLSLSGTKVDHIPKEIKYLENLETLDLEWCNVTELPGEILNLRKLRHLLAYNLKSKYDAMFDHTLSVTAPCDIGNLLTSLQCLCCIDANEVGGIKMVREIGKLTQLRRLEIAKLTSGDGKELCSSIANLTYLASLKIVSVEEGEKMDLDYFLSSSSSSTGLILLRRLDLCGCIEKVPQWISSLNALTTLTLVWSKLNEDPLNSLCYLPNLAYLWIHEAYVEGLSFKGGGFQKLKELSLAQFKCLKWVTVEKGSMPSLQKWDIWDCKLLQDLPRGIEHLTKLQDVNLGNMPSEFVERYFEEKRNEGDNWRMAHFPSFKFGIVKDGFWKFSN